MLKETFERIIEAVAAACREVYGDRLVALALFRSVARGTMRPDSDIDFLLIVDPLPADRHARLLEFEQVDERVGPALAQARLLWDPAGTLRGYLDHLRARLEAMGARRVGSGPSACWILKPDYRWGDRIEL